MTLITIAEADVAEWHDDRVPVEARLYANRDFIASDATFIAKGSDAYPAFYQTFPASVVGDKIRIGSGDAYATTDALNDDGLTTCTLIVYDENNAPIKTVLSNLRIPHGLSPITWNQLHAFSRGRRQARPSTYLHSQAILQLLAGYITAVVKATASIFGVVKLDVDAADLGNPVVPGINSPLLVNPAETDEIGHVFIDTEPADPAAPTAVGENSLALVNPATTAAIGHVFLSTPPLNPAIPIAVSDTDPRFSASIDNRVYRSSYDTFDDAVTAALNKELCFNERDVLAGTKTLSRFIKTSVTGDGIWETQVGHGLTVANLLDPGDRKLNDGEGKLITTNLPYVRQSWHSGPFGGMSYAAQSVNSSQTSISVNDASVWGAAPFYVSIDHEPMKVTAVVGNTLTVQRGYDGVTAVTHAGSTTLAAGINASETLLEMADSSQLGIVPCLILVGSELMRVEADNGDDIVRVTRNYDGAGAASHSLGATVSRRQEIYAYITDTMWEGMLESITAMKSGVIIAAPGKWTTRAQNAPTGLIIRGANSAPDADGGTVFRLIQNNSHWLKVGASRFHIGLEYLSIDLEGTTGSMGVDISGDGSLGQFSLNTWFKHVKFYRGDYGVRAYDTSVAARFMALNLLFDHCEFNYQSIACYGAGTVNGSWQFNTCNFTPAAQTGVAGTAVVGDHNYSGPAVHIDSTFNGQTPVSPQCYHTELSALNFSTELLTTVADHRLETGKIYKVYLAELETVSNMVVAAAGITTSGNARCAVVVGNVTKNVTVAVTTGSHTTATLIAEAFRVAVNADPDVSPVATMYRNGAKLYLRKKAHGDRQSAMNFTIEDVTSAGITDDLTADKEYGYSLPSATLTPLRTGPEDAIDLDRQAIWVRPQNSTTAYAYMNPHWAMLGNEDEYRLNLTQETTTLNGAINASTTTIIVANAAALGDIFGSNLLIDSEQVTPIALTGNTLTVIRGVGGPPAATHSGGATVTRLMAPMQMRTNQPVREGKPLAVFRIRNTHTPIKLVGGQDEAIPYFAIVESTFEKQKSIILDGYMSQAQLLLKSKCLITTKNCWLPVDWATDEWGVEAEYISENDQVFADGAIGGYKDLGNTLHHPDKMSVGAFCSYSKLHKENIIDQYLNRDYVPSQFGLNRNTSNLNKPLVEFCRPRNVSEKVWSRVGIREDYQENSLLMPNYHDTILLDPGIQGGLQYPRFAWWKEERSKSDAIGTAMDGRFFSGDIAHRGRHYNVKSTELVPVAGVVTVFGDKGPIFYTGVLPSDTTFNVTADATRGFAANYHEEITIYVAVDSSNNRLVSWGSGFYVPAPRSFNTGTLGSEWIFKFNAFGGNQLKMSAPPILVGTTGAIPDTQIRWRYAAGTSETMIPNVGYISNNAARVTLTLPVKSNIGDVLKITGTGGGSYEVAQAASQYIIWNSGGIDGTNKTTTGVGGLLEPQDPHDSIELMCIEANLGWKVITAKGNFDLT